MQPSLEKLQKFFRLEAERGFDNKAVVGGLNKILPAWENEARIERVPDDLIHTVVQKLNEYPDLQPENREEALKALWRTVSGSSRPAGNGQGHSEHTSPPAELPKPRKELQPPKQIHPEPSPRSTSGDSSRSETLRGPAPARSLRKTVDSNDCSSLGLNAPLTVLSGIGPKYAETLAKLDLHTLGDLLYYFPRRYDDYSQLRTIDRLWYGEEVTVIASVHSINLRPSRGSTQIVEAVVGDGTGFLRVTWFNQPWILNSLKPGTGIVLSGRVDQYLGRLTMTSPEWEPLEQEQLSTNRIVPVYALTSGVTQRWLRKVINQTVSYWAQRIPDYLPTEIRLAGNLVELPVALRNIHFPVDAETLAAARERLAFDEIFLLQLGVLRQKQTWNQAEAHVFGTDPEFLDSQIARLPYELTGAQCKAVSEICADLSSGRPMNRLLQGDVGSGKTVVAAMGAAMVLRHGAQAAVMAPTSILAEQHYKNFTRLLSSTPEDPTGAVLEPGQIRLLIGSTSEAEKREIREGLASGEIRLVIGTHALLEAPITFNWLQVVVVDEQHRFGVEQRAILRGKGSNPHLLVMTATPIPRSLALTVYGDLDLSVMNEMPAGRQVIETHVLFPRERERAYGLIRAQAEKGHQAFIIYPLVEQSERDESKAAVEEHARLQKEVFPHLKLGLLHGRMKPDEKDEVMTRFRDRQYNVLVSTSVVEVGVDVPNATVMVIEGANRFGLAQLHQFRGRVGRGQAQSYCLLIPETENQVENERLTVMAETNDGFVLAERDLDQRGPGDFLGTRQSGFSELRMASLSNVNLIEKARNQAQALFLKDPELASSEYTPLVRTLKQFWGETKGDIS